LEYALTLTKAEREFHRKIAAACFNEAWDYLEKRGRTADDDTTMLNLAHTSLYHWKLVGTQRHVAVSEWQLSRAYVEAGDARLALQLARSSLARCMRNGLSDIVHSANEGVARAYAASGDYQKARKHLDQARKQLAALRIPADDRKVFGIQIRDTESFILQKSKRKVAR
jgi:tetratricopeptide (TPR) repeat protein